MSQSMFFGYHKADIAFYRGYQLFKSNYHREIAVHLIQAIGLIIFMPIDVQLLQVGNNAIVAQVIGLVASLFSIILLFCQYYTVILKQGLLGYCIMARDIVHITNQPIQNADSEQSCTSETMLDASSEVLVAGIEQKVIQVYAKMVKNQLIFYTQQRFGYLGSFRKTQTAVGLISILTIIILMGKSLSLNSAEIAVLVCYLVLQALTKLPIIIGVILIALSPIICTLLICYICCCAKKQGPAVLDMQVARAQPDDIIKCDGQCSICLQDVKPGDEIYNRLPCSQKHIFHSGCLDKWSKVKLTCPSCRKELPVKHNQVRLVQANYRQPQSA